MPHARAVARLPWQQTEAFCFEPVRAQQRAQLGAELAWLLDERGSDRLLNEQVRSDRTASPQQWVWVDSNYPPHAYQI